MPRRKAAEPRSIHTRTRAGCSNCRSSKVKCDQKKPICSRCNQRGLSCHQASLSLKWEADYASLGLAFGRSGRWGKSKTTASSPCDGFVDLEAQEWCPVPMIRPWHFVNSDMSTFEQPNVTWSVANTPQAVKPRPNIGRTASDDGADYDDESMGGGLTFESEHCWDGTSLREVSYPSRGLPIFPSFANVDLTRGSLFIEYYLHQVCPRTTPSSKLASPFTSLVLPFCATASSTLFLAIQALAACHWSRSDPSWTPVCINLKSKVLGRLRSALLSSTTGSSTTDTGTLSTRGDDAPLNCDTVSEILVIMMMLCLCELTDDRGDKHGWAVHLRGAKSVIKFWQQQGRSSRTPIDSFTRRFFAFQDVIGRTACGEVAVFGTDFWGLEPDVDKRTVDVWMACSPELVSILSEITELSSCRQKIFSAPPTLERDHAASTFSAKATSLKHRLTNLVQIVEDESDKTLVMAAELKRIAAILYLHCAVYGETPSSPVTIKLVRHILRLVSTLLRNGIVASIAWPVFVAGVELPPEILLDDTNNDLQGREKDEEGRTVYSRSFVLEVLDAMARSNLSNVSLTRKVVVDVWNARDINSTLVAPNSGSVGLETPECNDWEWYVAPISTGVSLA